VAQGARQHTVYQQRHSGEWRKANSTLSQRQGLKVVQEGRWKADNSQQALDWQMFLSSQKNPRTCGILMCAQALHRTPARCLSWARSTGLLISKLSRGTAFHVVVWKGPQGPTGA